MGYGVFEELEKLRKQQEAARSKYGNTTKRTVTPIPEDTDYGVFNELRKLQEVDKLREERRTILSSNLASKKKDDDEDIAPVSEDKQEEEEERTWFQRGAFEDGFSLKNTAKAIIGSAEDVIENVGTGIAGMGEKIVDALAWAAPYVAQGQYYQSGGAYQSLEQQKQFEESIARDKVNNAKFIQKDLYDEEKLVKQIYSNNTVSKRLLNADPDDLSMFGEKSDALAQSAGQLAATVGLQAVGVPWYLTSGVTSFGGEVENALNEGATMEEAGLSGFVTAGAEILTEKISGGIKFGGKTLDDALVKEIARGVSNKTVRTLTKLGFDAAGEGFEEVLSGAISAVGQKLTYADDKELSELFSKEEAWESFIGGAVLGGGFSTINAIKAKKNGVDYVTELTTNEQKVVDKEYKDRVAEAEKNGKVSQSEKSKIYDRVLQDMEKGYISTDSIEAALGGDTYNNYRSTTASENNILKEFEELGKKQNPTLSETHRYNELVEQVKGIKEKKAGEQLKGKLSEEVKTLVAGDRLAESYNEIERKKQAFQADLTQYDEKQKATVKAAMESGVLNNSNRSHDMVDLAAKVSSDTGVPVRFSDTQKMKEAGLYPKRTVELKADGTTAEFDLGIKNLDANFKPIVKVGSTEVSNYTVNFENGKITFDSAPTGDVSVTVEGTEIVNAVYTKDGIVLNVKSPKYLETLTGHEIYHSFQKAKLDGNLKEAVKAFAEARGDFEARLKDKQEKYKGIKDADPESEVIADLIGEYIFEGRDFITELSVQNRNVFQKMYDGIKHLVKLATAGSKEARRLAQVEREFEKAYRALAQKNTATEGGVNYDIAVLDNGNVYVTASRKVIEGKTKAEQRKDISNFFSALLDGNPSLDIQTIEGDVLTITKKETAAKARDDYKTVNGQQIPMTDAEFAVKMHIESHIDEVAEVSKPTNSAQDNKNHPFAKDGFTYRRAYFEDFDGQYYEVTLSIGNNGTVATVYNVGKIKGSVPPSAKLIAVVGSKPLGGTLSKAGIPQNSDDVKKDFSLSAPIEETKELVALHNLTADKLSKSLELGGLPMPSLAITKADIPHSNFGDITLVFGKETIDPKANKKNKVYSADAWTPVFPRVEYEADSKVGNQISKKLRELEGKIDDTFQRDLRRIQYGFEDYLNSQGGEEGLIQHAMENYGLKAAYLEEQGKHIDKITVQQEAEKGYNPDNADKYQKIMDILGVSTAEEIANVNLKDARDNHGAELEAVYPGITKTAMRMGRMFSIVKTFLESNGSAPVYNTVTDVNATRRAVDEALDIEGFETWTRNLFAGIVKDSGIYNNKDLFTPSGNRRSFKQTHLPVTLENIVKAMATQNGGNSKNVSGFNGIKTLRAATAETFKSVADMHNRKDRLQHLTQEQADALNDEMQNRLFEIMHTIDNEGRQSSERNPYIRMDSIGETIAEIGESGRYNVADIQKTFREYGKEISDDTALAVKQLLFDVTQMPVNIFEAKPQRVVSFDEAKAFVVPNNLDAKLKQELLNRGYNIAEYDPNVEGDRQRVVNQFEELKFSLADASEQPKQSGYRATLGKDVALEAPVAISKMETTNATAEDSSVTTTTVSNTESVADLFPDDAAPIQEEYENLLAEREDIKGAMDAYAAVGNYDSAERLMAEYEAVQARIAEIEADDTDRLASLDEADAPPELDNAPEDVADNVPLTKVLVNNLAKQVKSQLGLGNNRTAEVRELIERYSNEEFPSKAHLYTEIQERFGTITETEVDEDLKNVKNRLRTYGINVDESIKAEIPDYAQMMRSNFGKVRFSKEGLPVDVAYNEFSEALPGYFPEDIYVPADQLMRIIEVANMDTTMENTFEIDWQTIEDVTDTIMNGVAEFKQNRKETLANKHGRESFQSLMESADQYVPPIPENVAPVRPAIQSVQAEPDDIAPVFDTSSGQQSILPEVEVPKTRAEQRRNKQEGYTKMWEDMLGDTSTWKDMPIGLQYKTKTLRRILRKVVKDADGKSDFQKADRIYDELETKYDHNEALLKRESQNLKEVFFKLNLNHVEDTYAHMLGELRHNPDTELTEDVVKEYYEKHKGRINTGKVDKAIVEARKTFDDLIVRVNEVLKEQGMKEIPYRKGYFPHFTNPKQGWLAKLLNWKTIDTEIPTSIAGLTEAFKPQRSWQSFNKQRTGDTTDYSLYQGLDTYIHGALDWIYHIEDLQKRRALENHIRYTHSDEGVQERIQEINAGDYDADEAQAMINAVLDEAENPLSGLVRELMNRTNTLANKKSSMDRGAEDMTNRKIYSTMTNLNNRITANMVVGSFSSALTNFIPIVQSWHQVSPIYSVRGIADTVRSAVVDDGTIAKSDFLTNRLVEEENLYQTGWDKVTDKAAFMMNVIDNITAQTVWRSKYLQNVKEGMSENQAIKDADQFAKNVIGGRSRGNAPTVFDAKNPLAKIFTSFQLEVANQYGYMFEDVVQDSRNAARLVKGYATAFLGAYLYNSLYSSLVGRDAAFDPISIVEDLLKGLFDDDEEEDDLTDDLLAFGEDVVQQVPFVGGLFGGGRVPISAALPYSGDQTPFKSMLDDASEENWGKLGKEFLKPIYYLAMPVGGGQLKKTVEGLKMFDEDLPIAGSYTDSGNLRFPVEDTTGNRVQAALFGQWASENARDYFDNERKPLQEKQIQELIDSDMPIRDYWDYREGLAEHEKLADKADYIDSLDLPISTKNMLVNNVAGRKEPIDMADYGRYGSLEEMDFATKNPEKYMVALNIGGYARYMGYQAGMKDMKLAEKADYISKLDLTVAQKNLLINSETDRKEPIDLTGYENFSNFEEFEFAKKNPEAYAMAKTVGGYEAYTEYSDALGDIKADKDKFGKSISGTRKTKVVAYINSLNIPVTQKYILLKSEYPSTDDYNYEIIDYVNSMDDMTFEEKIEVLRKLDFDVDAEGNIYW